LSSSVRPGWNWLIGSLAHRLIAVAFVVICK
jgi:hypothetical protein